MGRLLVAMAVAATMLAGGGAQAQIKGPPPAVVAPPPAVPQGVRPRPVAFTRMVSRLLEGQGIGTYYWGAICIEPISMVWRSEGKSAAAALAFSDELAAAGLKGAGGPTELFDRADAVPANLEVGAILGSVEATACESLTKANGRILLEVEWQVYSRLDREVVATVTTRAGVQRAILARNKAAEFDGLFREAFAANARALMSDSAFRALVLAGEPGAPSAAASAAGLAPITLSIVAGGAATAIRDAPGSVVTIFSGDSMGSGFLVSADGYVLTNQHVVGGAKYVKVRWSDGAEGVGEVMRSDKRRDVALIKVDSRARRPLTIRRDPAQIGDGVYAIGTPLERGFQNTLTRGVVSASRVLDGLSYIQSDVAIDHGNSGGPLLDEGGRVVGISVAVFQPDGTQRSLNFFIPIGDALDFLALKAP